MAEQTTVVDFTTVTEVAGDEVSQEQIERLAHRYVWAGEFCHGRDVLEVACGSGQGLGHIATVARSVRAGDISAPLIARARAHYGARVPIEQMDAGRLPIDDQSMDVIILFEAIYYLPSAERFVEECRRVLRPGGVVLVATANKDLYDFNPSPYSHRYYGVAELGQLFGSRFECRFFGATPVDAVSLRQRILRPIKTIVVKLDLMPKTMAGKKLLKRLVFGNLRPMPPEITAAMTDYVPPVPLPAGNPDKQFKVIYLAATLISPIDPN